MRDFYNNITNNVKNDENYNMRTLYNMGFFDDVWSTMKDIGKGVGDVVTTVAPILPFILKKGGSVKQEDTPTNRRKLLNAWNKAHPGRQITMPQLTAALKAKGMTKVQGHLRGGKGKAKK